MKRLRKLAIWIIMTLYLVLVFGFVGSQYEDQLCNRILINIQDSVYTGFLESEDIIQSLEKNELHYLGVPLAEINLNAIEKAIITNQIINTCVAYTGIDGTLHVDITQRKPFVRIIESNGKGFYLDQKGNVLSLSPRFSPHVLVFNGNIRTSVRVGEPTNVHSLEDNKANRRIREVLELAKYIDENELWKAQFVQVFINAKGEYELVPRIGPHIIMLGPIDDYKRKFEKLEVFYQQGLNTLGWNQYLNINLKYKDQVVCTKI